MMGPRKIVALTSLILSATGLGGCGGSVQSTNPGAMDAASPVADAAGTQEAAPPIDVVDAAEVGEAAPPIDAADVREATPPAVDATPPCGGAGQACCGTSCNAGQVCVALAGVSQCETCGQPGQPCCTTMPACADTADSCFVSGALHYCLNYQPGTLGQPGDGCTTTCVDPASTCVSNGMSAYCIACGGLGNPCCGGTTCGASLQCTAGTCQ